MKSYIALLIHQLTLTANLADPVGFYCSCHPGPQKNILNCSRYIRAAWFIQGPRGEGKSRALVVLFIAMISIVGKVGLLAVQYIVLVLHIIWLVVTADPGGAFHRHNLNRALLVAAELTCAHFPRLRLHSLMVTAKRTLPSFCPFCAFGWIGKQT